MDKNAQNSNMTDLDGDKSLEATTKKVDLTKKKKKENKPTAIDTIKLIINGKLSEVISDSLLNDESLKLAEGKKVLFQIERKEDMDDLEGYLQGDGKIGEVAILLPSTEVITKELMPLMSFARIKQIPIVIRKG